MKLLKREIPNSTYLGKSIKNNKCLICGSEEIIDDRCLDCGNPSIDIYTIERKTHPKKHILKMSFNLSKTQKYNFPVGIVVTLKSNDGVNRIGQFRRDIERTSWEITPIDVNNIIETKIRLKEKIIFKN